MLQQVNGTRIFPAAAASSGMARNQRQMMLLIVVLTVARRGGYHGVIWLPPQAFSKWRVGSGQRSVCGPVMQRHHPAPGVCFTPADIDVRIAQESRGSLFIERRMIGARPATCGRS